MYLRIRKQSAFLFFLQAERCLLSEMFMNVPEPTALVVVVVWRKCYLFVGEKSEMISIVKYKRFIHLSKLLKNYL